MADTPASGVPDDAPPAVEPPRRSLPRAARLSRLSPGSEPAPASTPPPAAAPPPPPKSPAAPVPPAATAPVPAATAPAAETASPPVAPPVPDEPVSGGVRVVELIPEAAPTPSAAVRAAQEAAERAAARTPSAPVVFKPLQDELATRSAIVSVIGLVLCFFPALSLVGLGMGLVARRRIQRSAGQLLGTGSASLGILLGAAGVVVGTTADIVFLLRR